MSLDEAAKQVGKVANSMANGAPALLFATLITFGALYLSYEANKSTNKVLESVLDAKVQSAAGRRVEDQERRIEDQERIARFTEMLTRIEANIDGVEGKLDVLLGQRENN